MNWEALGAISEAIGVVAILISLAYLAVQIRQSTHAFSRGIEANQLAAFERNIESGNRLREVLLLNPDLIDLMTKGYASYTTLDAAAKIRFGLLLRNIFSSMQGAYVRHLSLENDPRGFEGSARLLDEILRNPGVREWLMGKRPDWRSEFHELVDERLALLQQNENGE
jgi:hypothetical protein